MSSNMKNATPPLEDAACEAVRLNPSFSGKPSYVTPQDRVTFVNKLAALAARSGADPAL